MVAATGFRHARVLIVTRTEARRDWVWEAIEQIGVGFGPEILERFWVAAEAWRVPGVEGLCGLV
ncbi:MAG: hypothetical protein P4L33_11340 [Capsulimonadaceae bacterium]|nr:hypothetical protein [Capsulimonadaceae bacterium]